MRNSIRSLLLVTAATGLAVIAQAVPTLKLSDGITTVTVADGSVGDSYSAPNVVTYIGSVGSWTFNATMGVLSGSNSLPVLDLSSVDVSSSKGGTLKIWFSADGFGPTSGGAASIAGGTIGAGGTASFATYYNSTNTLFSGSLLTSQGPFGAGAFSGSANGGAISSAISYSLTTYAEIHHAGKGVTSFNFVLKVPDGGITALLLSFALLGVGLISHRWLAR